LPNGMGFTRTPEQSRKRPQLCAPEAVPEENKMMQTSYQEPTPPLA
jgi:hypothetical protein